MMQNEKASCPNLLLKMIVIRISPFGAVAAAFLRTMIRNVNQGIVPSITHFVNTRPIIYLFAANAPSPVTCSANNHSEASHQNTAVAEA